MNRVTRSLEARDSRYSSKNTQIHVLSSDAGGSGARVSVVLEAYKIPWPFYGATVRHDLVDKRRAGVSADQRADYAICALIVTVMAIFLLYISQQDFE